MEKVGTRLSFIMFFSFDLQLLNFIFLYVSVQYEHCRRIFVSFFIKCQKDLYKIDNED